MAKVICSFIHPKDNKRYFYIHNTHYEALETIPMDLANFMWYYQSHKIQINWFDINYLDLKKRMDNYFVLKTKDYKEMVYKMVYHTGVNEMAKINQVISDKLEEFLSTKENEDLLVGVSIIFQSSKFTTFRPLDFYSSWHYTWQLFSRNNIEKPDDLQLLKLIKHENEVDLDAYAAYFLELIQQFKIPFICVPHILRNKENIRNYFIKNNYQTLLPFDLKELDKNRKIHTFKKKKPSAEEINFFFKAIKNCEFGLSNSLIEEISLTNKQEYKLTLIEKKNILNNILYGFSSLVNLLDDDNKEILPPIYTDEYLNQLETESPFVLWKYGVQLLDLYSIYGKLLYEEAHWYDFNYPFVYIQASQESKLMIYNEDTDMLYLYYQFKIPLLSIGQVFGGKAEDKIFFLNGFLNQKYEMDSPFCFESKQSSNAYNDKCFSEGLAPVSFNGKWGYIDHSSSIVIPFIFGDAYPFKDGKAKVFKLKDQFIKPIGEWRDIPSYENIDHRFSLTLKQFKLKYPDFPTIVSKPLSYFRDRTMSDLQLAMEYHSFQHGLFEIETKYSDISYFGKWITIDKLGNELDDEIPNHNLNNKKISVLENYSFENKESNYWLSQVMENEYLAINIPDSLYLNKDFILNLIEKCPSSYKCLNYIYAEDHECKLVYEKAMNQLISISHSESKEQAKSEDELPF